MILDIIILIFIVVSVFVGLKRGFVDTLIRLAGGIIALILAFTLQTSVADFITNQTGMDKQIAEGVKTSVNKMLVKEDNKTSNNESTLENSKLFAKTYEDIKNSQGEARESKLDEWSKSIAKFVVKGISFIAIFIVVSILIMIIRLILGGIMDLPVLKQLDGVAGLGAGFVLSIIQLLVIFAIISFISPMEIMSGINKLIEGSTIAKYLYNNNFLVTIISSKIL